MGANLPTDDFALADLVSLWQRRRAAGEAVSAAELCRTCPELLPELEKRIAALERISDLANVMHETVTVAPDTNGDSAAHGAATLDPYATLPPSSPGQSTPVVEILPDGPVVPGYEVLGVLGKGGMGVVYKARQRGLGRIVALKMILHAEHAGEHERQRFQAEAEAVARLQHPNIVQIHEVGEQRGLPYFSLEFCPGGSLADKLDGTPLPPKEAAKLVQTLAIAMQAAHDKGILHRDLKPANVLLAEDGTPKITDFGLAKKLGEKGQTQTGQVLGTPSYMAPEQAGGKTKDMGAACDVYALGAILYELLTGRPPFKGPTSLDTILQVISDEPVAVRQLQPKVPRDLETICLKCLNKLPKQRYPSARELAEDLHRYLSGEPIKGRRASAVARASKWVNRHPLWTLILTSFVLGVLRSAPFTFVMIFAVYAAFAVVSFVGTIRLVFPQPPIRVRIKRGLLLLSFLLANCVAFKLLFAFANVIGLNDPEKSVVFYVVGAYLVVIGGLEAGSWMGLVVGVISRLVHWRLQRSYLVSVIGCTIGSVCGTITAGFLGFVVPFPESVSGASCFVISLIALWLGCAVAGAIVGAKKGSQSRAA